MDPDVRSRLQGTSSSRGPVAAIRPMLEVADCEVDAQDMVVMPGLVEAHRHL